jgi:hypothetical protein
MIAHSSKIGSSTSLPFVALEIGTSGRSLQITKSSLLVALNIPHIFLSRLLFLHNQMHDINLNLLICSIGYAEYYGLDNLLPYKVDSTAARNYEALPLQYVK